MEPEDAFDAVHLRASEQVEAFLEDLEGSGREEGEAARRIADIAFLFVEYLANTYPKLPRDATERDAWVFLFDYVVVQSPFGGPAVEGAPHALALFIDWLARRERVREAAFLRAACGEVEYFRARFSAYRRIAERVARGGPEASGSEDALDAWWAELDDRMRLRGLTPDHALAGGEETWNAHMGPLEAAVFDALCLLLSARARELRSRGLEGEKARPELLRVQREFMIAPNRGLGTTPLAAIVKERERGGPMVGHF